MLTLRGVGDITKRKRLPDEVRRKKVLEALNLVMPGTCESSIEKELHDGYGTLLH